MTSKVPNPIPPPSLSERISIFEPNHKFYERRFAGPTSRKGPVSLSNQDTGKGKNFNEIKSQFDSRPSSVKNSVGFQGSFWNKLQQTATPSVRKTVVSVPVSNEITTPTTLKLVQNNRSVVGGDKLVLAKNLNNTSDNNKLMSKKESQPDGDKPIQRTISIDSNSHSDVIFTKTSDLQMGNMVMPKIHITDESRTSYWSQQALQNENMQKITEAMKLDVSSREKKITTLTKELDDLNSVWSSDDDVQTLKRQKHELEMRLKVEEDEIDDLASQIELLEHSKTKMEMTLAALKKEHRREMALKDEELEDARIALQKKVKALELQLETEREERINHVREKHELETKLLNFRDYAVRSNDGEKLKKTKVDLRRMKALLNDAEVMVEKSKLNSSSHVIVKQLKNQLEDAEFSKIAVVKSKQNVELELSDVQSQLEDIMRAKSELEEKVLRSNREKVALRTQLEDKDEELQETMKKFRAAVGQMSVHQITIQEQLNRIEEHEIEKSKLKEHVSELMIRLESLEGETIMNIHHSRLKLKIQELESKLELEKTTRDRMDSQICRLKDAVERLNEECFVLRSKEFSNQEMVSKLQEQLKQAKEDYATILKKETETNLRCHGLEKQLELAEAETVLAKNDLKLSLRRIEDIHLAIKEEAESDSDTDSSFSSESETSDDETSKFSSGQFNKTHTDLDNRQLQLKDSNYFDAINENHITKL